MGLRTTMRKVNRHFYVVLSLCFVCAVGVMLAYLLNFRNIPSTPRRMKVNNARQEITPIIIVTYMRSGSTLLGDILQQDPDVFYLFEPLHHIGRSYQRQMMGTYQNGSFLSKLLDSSYRKQALSLIRAWLTCDLAYITEDDKRIAIPFFKLGKKTSRVLNCIKAHNDTGLYVNKKLLQCVERLQQECRQSSFVLIKTIRMEMKWVIQLFNDFPNMKILYLLRDPRDTITSQRKFGRCSSQKFGGIEGCSRYLCSNIENDLAAIEEADERFSNRIKIVQFEDMANYPIQTSESLYDFLGTKFLPHIQDFVVSLTSAGNAKTSVLSDVRPNSKDQVNKWKSELKKDQIQVIEKNCLAVILRTSRHR